MDHSSAIKKLRMKSTDKVVIINPPTVFTPAIDLYEGNTELSLSAPSSFIIAFIKNSEEASDYLPHISRNVEGDGILWICYPKKTSRNYDSDISRDNGWEVLEEAGFTGVAMVSLDEDWSALRFRKKEFSARK